MRKTLLSLALLLTLGNLALGISYAAVCQSSGGSRACGATCATAGDGACLCGGSCTAEERKWVEGAKGPAAAMEEAEVY